MGVNVEEIMKEIREQIAKKNYKDILEFSDIEVTQINYDNQIEWYRPIEGSKIKAFFKKIVRKSVAFLIRPIVTDQNYLNRDIVKNIDDISFLCKKQEERILELEKEILKLKGEK